MDTRYKNWLSQGRAYQLACHDVILCTCSVASASALEQHLDVRQIIIDECAMSTEPETLIPLVCHHRAEKVCPCQRRVSGTAAQGSQTSSILYHAALPRPVRVLKFVLLYGVGITATEKMFWPRYKVLT